MSDGVEPEKSNASKLLDRLEKWKQTPKGVTVIAHRDEGDGWWQIHIETMGWLDELARHMERLGKAGRPVTYMEAGLDSARRAILCTDWTMRDAPQGPREHLSASDLAVVAGAVMIVDATGVALADAAALTQLLPFVDEARELVNGITDLDAEVRDYLLELVNRLDQAIHGAGVRGESDVRRWVSELIGALAIYAHNGDEEQNGRVKSFMDRFVPAVKVFLFRDLPLALTTGIVQEAILGG